MLCIGSILCLPSMYLHVCLLFALCCLLSLLPSAVSDVGAKDGVDPVGGECFTSVTNSRAAHLARESQLKLSICPPSQACAKLSVGLPPILGLPARVRSYNTEDHKASSIAQNQDSSTRATQQ
jgi:hypothetical protein